MPSRLNYSRKAKQVVKKNVLYEARLKLFQQPVTASDGNTYWFDMTAEKEMEDAIYWLNANPLSTIPWRQANDAGTTHVNSLSLKALIEDLKLKRAERAMTLDAEYTSVKTKADSNTLTQKDVDDWLSSHGIEE